MQKERQNLRRRPESHRSHDLIHPIRLIGSLRNRPDRLVPVHDIALRSARISEQRDTQGLDQLDKPGMHGPGIAIRLPQVLGRVVPLHPVTKQVGRDPVPQALGVDRHGDRPNRSGKERGAEGKPDGEIQ